MTLRGKEGEAHIVVGIDTCLSFQRKMVAGFIIPQLQGQPFPYLKLLQNCLGIRGTKEAGFALNPHCQVKLCSI